MHPSLCLLLHSCFVTSLADPSPPASTYPFSTTMLRTHHYSNDKPFLSIYEQLGNPELAAHIDRVGQPLYQKKPAALQRTASPTAQAGEKSA